MSVWSITKSPHGNQSQPFTELLRKKIIHHSVQLNRGISVTPNQPFYFLLSPLFCEESGSKRDSNNCTEWHIRSALNWTSNDYLCVYDYLRERECIVCVYVIWTHAYTYIDPQDIVKYYHMTSWGEMSRDFYSVLFFHVYILIIKSCSCPSLNYFVLCISLLYISYFLRWTQMLWFCKCLQSWIGIKSLIWELSLKKKNKCQSSTE